MYVRTGPKLEILYLWDFSDEVFVITNHLGYNTYEADDPSYLLCFLPSITSC